MKASLLNKEFYKGRRVFITGHTGFKGAWLVQILHELGAVTRGYSLQPEPGCLFEKIKGAQLTDHITGDVRDKDKLSEALAAFKPEIVLHLAARAIVKDCYDNPHYAFETNVMGTVNLFEAVRQCPDVKSTVIVTTDKVYENKGDGAVYKTGDSLGGADPYAASKTCMEFVTEAYKKAYLQTDNRNIGVATVRASNVIAGGDHVESRLIPSILRGFAQNKPAELRNPDQTRPWQSVLDAMNGYLTVARKLFAEPEKYSMAWNIGPSTEGICPVGSVFEKIRLYFGTSEVYVAARKFDVNESKTLGLDIEKSVELLEWEPEQPLDKILFELTDFFKRQQCGENERDICSMQIREFFGA